jgi:hypothetical protein
VAEIQWQPVPEKHNNEHQTATKTKNATTRKIIRQRPKLEKIFAFLFFVFVFGAKIRVRVLFFSVVCGGGRGIHSTK